MSDVTRILPQIESGNASIADLRVFLNGSYPDNQLVE